MRTLAHPDSRQLSMSAVLHALSDPVRLDIVRALADGSELCCGAMSVPVSKSTLTHHLKVLREAGLTWTRCEGVQRFVSLRREDLERRFPGLLACVLRAQPAAALETERADLVTASPVVTAPPGLLIADQAARQPVHSAA